MADPINGYNCQHCGKRILIGHQCDCWTKRENLIRDSMEQEKETMKSKEEMLELSWQWIKRRCPNIPETTMKCILKASYEDGFAFAEQRVKGLEEENKKLQFNINAAYREIEKLKSELDKANDGLTIAYMSGAADEKERSREEISKLREESKKQISELENNEQEIIDAYYKEVGKIYPSKRKISL